VTRSVAPAARLNVRAVLFDLDGTLADTAGDLAGALNRVRADRALPPVPLEVLRAPSIEEAREHFRRHLSALRPRVYRETTILYDS